MARQIITDFPFIPAMWSYGAAALIFAAFAGRFVLGWRGGARAAVLLCAAICSALWGLALLLALALQAEGWWHLAGIIDAICTCAWLGFLLLLIAGGRQHQSVGRWQSALPWLFGMAGATLLASAILARSPPWIASLNDGKALFASYASLGAAVIGLALTEQLYRRTPQNRRWAIKPLIIGLGGMFAFDLLTFSSAVLFRHQDAALWATRGIAHGLVVFFIAVASARNASWTMNLYISRNVVFHSTAFLIAGVYLLLTSAAGYWVRYFGGDWGGVLQITFVFAALLGLASISLSGRLRALLRVYIGKNLFTHRYDYRTEWLRFTRLLGTAKPEENTHQQIVQAFADLVESVGGSIWLERGGSYVDAARLHFPEVADAEPAGSSLVSFLSRSGWIVRVDEFSHSPSSYPNLVLPNWLTALENAWLVIPLQNSSALLGFVILARPRTPIDVNWEVLDLLKTASRQAASYLAQFRANAAIVEIEKFAAFNRMSAFVIHDLKNLVAQLALMLRNAERHRDNPAFQRDMLGTVEHVVARMNDLMLQLRTGTTPMEKTRPVDLQTVIERIVARKALHAHPIDLAIGANIRALAHDDRLERVIGHIVQNAIEASEAAHEPIRIRTFITGNSAVVEVADHGVGMSEEFIRQRLFHAFQTTKSQGMGIGMYESFQYITSIGGRIAVDSKPGQGTRIGVFLPLADPIEAPAEIARKVA